MGEDNFIIPNLPLSYLFHPPPVATTSSPLLTSTPLLARGAASSESTLPPEVGSTHPTSSKSALPFSSSPAPSSSLSPPLPIKSRAPSFPPPPLCLQPSSQRPRLRLGLTPVLHELATSFANNHPSAPFTLSPASIPFSSSDLPGTRHNCLTHLGLRACSTVAETRHCRYRPFRRRPQPASSLRISRSHPRSSPQATLPPRFSSTDCAGKSPRRFRLRQP
ncbi:hypothetical protein PR202_gb00047 [Eleusine coracana subsp. coracana]|uniref:Uncharacterized protein n=1 Tax=Eleusine coracana subsp. coracana TaxID=191504 RepID=A0AAV5DS71_ELECO|nr:hypothetical protein PR202_gb00047 [Eleusine coracana subsp. coracana]